MFNIDMNNLNNLSPDDLKKCVEAVASHLESGKDLKHKDIGVNKCALQALDQNMANNTPSKEVLDDLHALLLISIEKGLEDTQNGVRHDIRTFQYKCPKKMGSGMTIGHSNINVRMSCLTPFLKCPNVMPDPISF